MVIFKISGCKETAARGNRNMMQVSLRPFDRTLTKVESDHKFVTYSSHRLNVLRIFWISFKMFAQH